MSKRLFQTVRLLCWALLLPFIPLQASDTPPVEDAFVIPGVEVDITASSANEARAKGMEEAQRLAFLKLIAAHVPEKEQAAWQALPSTKVETLVQDVEITKEKYSSVRYLATFTVSFKTTEVQELLDKHLTQAPSSDTRESGQNAAQEADPAPLPGRASVIVPIFLLEGKKFLWEEQSPWFQWFVEDPHLPSLLLVPTGDLTDRALTLSQALEGTPEALAQMRGRYDVPQVLVAILSEKDKGQPVLEMFLYDQTGLVTRQTKPLLPQDNLEATLKAAGAMVATFVEAPARPAQITPQESVPADVIDVGTVEIEVVFASLKEWLLLKKSLENLPGVRGVFVKRLARSFAVLRLKTHLTPETLVGTLSQAGMSAQKSASERALKVRLTRPRGASPQDASLVQERGVL